MKNKDLFLIHGFTLIELLVVISIISLLSTVVMANLNQSKTKAQEASIKQDLQSIRTQAELSYGKTGDYSGVDPEIAQILAHINKNGGTATVTYSNFFPVNEGYKRYAVSAKLNSDPTKNYSVSSDGGVVVWDVADIGSDNWNNAKISCKNIGKRLPTIEELKSIRDSHGAVPNSFTASDYWSDTYSGPYANAYIINMSNGSVGSEFQNNLNLVRCVK